MQQSIRLPDDVCKSVGMTNSVNPDQIAPSGAGYSGFMLLDELYLEK